VRQAPGSEEIPAARQGLIFLSFHPFLSYQYYTGGRKLSGLQKCKVEDISPEVTENTEEEE
jgi:hypothetical protein